MVKFKRNLSRKLKSSEYGRLSRQYCLCAVRPSVHPLCGVRTLVTAKDRFGLAVESGLQCKLAGVLLLLQILLHDGARLWCMLTP